MNDGREGRWQDHRECREAFETEMHVHCGTNERSFEKLGNPPSYEPAKCSRCGTVIVLGDDGYSLRGGRHLRYKCTAKEAGNPFV